MQLFKKKKLVLPELPAKSGVKKEEETEILSDAVFPDELPELEIKSKTFESPETELDEVSLDAKPISMPKMREIGKEKLERGFVSTEKYKEILSEINAIKIDFDNVDFWIARAAELNSQRNEKTDAMQNDLEEISKRLMFIEDALFGG